MFRLFILLLTGMILYFFLGTNLYTEANTKARPSMGTGKMNDSIHRDSKIKKLYTKGKNFFERVKDIPVEGIKYVETVLFYHLITDNR